MAIQGLWAVPWMMEVERHDARGCGRPAASRMGVVDAGGLCRARDALGTRLARRGITPRAPLRHRFRRSHARGARGDRRCDVPGSYLWWALYGLGAAVNVLAFTAAERGLPDASSPARANTTLNLMMFGGSFVAQWGIGIVVETRAQRGRCAAAERPARRRSRSCWRSTWPRMLWFARGWSRQMAPVRCGDQRLTRSFIMHLHILGICGTFMGGLAAIAQAAGHASPAATRTSIRRCRRSSRRSASR